MGVKIEGLDFGYSSEKILDGVYGAINKGEFATIIGPNGTGKSTLVKCINGILKAQNGKVHIGGTDIGHMPLKDVGKMISYVPQSSNSLFNLSVFDMVLLGRRPHSSWRCSKNDREKALKALEFLNIEHLAMRNYNELSGGQQQKVIIARALAQETQIIILDEPISNLDIRHQIEVMEIIKELVNKAGVTVISIVHDLNLAIRYSDKIVVMNHGRIVAIGEPQKVMTEDIISSVYGVRAKLMRIDDDVYVIPQELIKME